MGDLTKDFDSTEFASVFRGVTTQVPKQLWPHLQRLANNLQVLRDTVGRSITINSGYRTVRHNAAVGGTTESQHLDAAAADFTIAGLSPSHSYCMMELLIKDGQVRQGGLGAYVAHTHYDPRGTPARWTKGITKPDCSEVSLPDDDAPPPVEEEDDMADPVARAQIMVLIESAHLQQGQIDFLAAATAAQQQRLNNLDPGDIGANQGAITALAAELALVEGIAEANAKKLAAAAEALA